MTLQQSKYSVHLFSGSLLVSHKAIQSIGLKFHVHRMVEFLNHKGNLESLANSILWLWQVNFPPRLPS